MKNEIDDAGGVVDVMFESVVKPDTLRDCDTNADPDTVEGAQRSLANT